MSKSRKIVHSEARSISIICNVIKFFDEQKLAGQWSFPLQQPTQLAAAATGKSVTFIKQLRKEMEAAQGTTVHSPKKKREHVANKIELDGFDQNVLRQMIHQIYTVEHKIPTLSLLLKRMKANTAYAGGRETLRKYLLKLGFRFKKCHNKRKLLMERNDIIAWRSRYLRKLRENDNLDNKKPVTYLDETFIHPSYGVNKCWQSDEEPGVYKCDRTGQRHIIVHAGGSYGFVNNAVLIFKSKGKSGDYHDDMNHTNFMHWLETQLIPNLPPNGIVVMDNAPYHSKQINKPPTATNRKEEIREWLEANNISTTSEMRKAELLMMVKQYPTNKMYYVDELLKKHGHTVIRLPPYHCELNPIEMIWSSMKRKVAMNNVLHVAQDMENLIRNAFTEITVEEWENHCHHVKKVADSMWEADGIYDDVVENLCFSVNTGSSDEDGEWESDSSDEEEGSD